MATTLPEEKLVYIALRNVFRAQDAKVRQPTSIRSRIEASKDRAVKDFIKAYKIANVCGVATGLLKAEIFESTEKAQARFPELFEVSPEQWAERAASEAAAAKAEADAIKDAVEESEENLPLTLANLKESVERAAPGTAAAKIGADATKDAAEQPQDKLPLTLANVRKNAERAVSEAAAAKAEADATKNAAEESLDKPPWTLSNKKSAERAAFKAAAEESQKSFASSWSDSNEGLPKLKQSQICLEPRPGSHTGSSLSFTVSVPSLYPTYLPFITQHRLLVKVQDLLEKACYSFAQRTLPNMLQREGWTCPESVELNKWARILRANEHRLSAEGLRNLGSPFNTVLDSLATLRHTAVHRLPVTATKVEEFLLNAEALATLLQEEACADALTQLRREVQLIIGELGRNKHLLEFRMAGVLKTLADQRAELDRVEQKVKDDMRRDDQNYVTMLGSRLEQVIQSAERVAGDQYTTDDGTDSGADADSSSFCDADVVWTDCDQSC